MDNIVVKYDNVEQSYEEVESQYIELKDNIDNFNVNLNFKHFITPSTVGLEPQEGSVWFKLE